MHIKMYGGKITKIFRINKENSEKNTAQLNKHTVRNKADNQSKNC